MLKSLHLALLIPLICVLLVYLKPDITKEGLSVLDDLKTNIVTKLFHSKDQTKSSSKTQKKASTGKQKSQGSKKTSEKPKEEPKPAARGVLKKPSKLKPNPNCVPPKELLFSKEELSEYTGKEDSPGLLLAYLGVVYDVSKGAKHYGPGGGYEFFAGRDATRAFTSGEFNETGLVDNVDGFSVDSFGSIKEWADFYEKDYVKIGRVEGSYFDSEGCPTEKIEYVKKMYKLYERNKQEEENEMTIYPPCNSEWSGETGITRFWCSSLSGGVNRGWVGYPRKLFSAKSVGGRCACIREDEAGDMLPSIEYEDSADKSKEVAEQIRFERYPDCDAQSHECIIKT